MNTLLASLSAVALALVPVPAFAQAMEVICNGLPGCGAGPENTLITRVLPAATFLMIQLVAGASVVFVMIGGVRMLLSAGDDGKAQAGRKQVISAVAGLGLAIVSATAVSFVTTENYGQANPQNFLFGAGGLLDSVVRLILTLFNVGFVIMVLYAGLKMALASGASDEFKKGGQIIRWAIVGAVVVNLARAIVQAFLALDL